MELHVQHPGEIQLIEVASLKSKTIVIGRHRTVYMSSTTGALTFAQFCFEPLYDLCYLLSSTFSYCKDAKKIYDFLQDLILHEKMLFESVKTVISPGLMSDNTDYLRKVRPSPKYDVIFTVINPQPEKVNFDWNNEVIIERE